MQEHYLPALVLAEILHQKNFHNKKLVGFSEPTQHPTFWVLKPIPKH